MTKLQRQSQTQGLIHAAWLGLSNRQEALAASGVQVSELIPLSAQQDFDALCTELHELLKWNHGSPIINGGKIAALYEELNRLNASDREMAKLADLEMV